MILFSTFQASMEQQGGGTVHQPPAGNNQTFGLFLETATAGLGIGRVEAGMADTHARTPHVRQQSESGERTPTGSVQVAMRAAGVDPFDRHPHGSSELCVRSLVAFESDAELVAEDPQGNDYRPLEGTALTGSFVADTIVFERSVPPPSSVSPRSGDEGDGDGTVVAPRVNGQHATPAFHAEHLRDESVFPARSLAESITRATELRDRLPVASITNAGGMQQSGMNLFRDVQQLDVGEATTLAVVDRSSGGVTSVTASPGDIDVAFDDGRLSVSSLGRSGRSSGNHRAPHAKRVGEGSWDGEIRTANVRQPLTVGDAPMDFIGAYASGQGTTSARERGWASASNSHTPRSHLRDMADAMEDHSTHRATSTPLESAGPANAMRRGDNLFGEMAKQNSSYLDQARGQVGRAPSPSLMSEYSARLFDSLRNPVDIVGLQVSSEMQIDARGFQLHPTEMRPGHARLAFDTTGHDRVVAEQRLESLLLGEQVQRRESTVTAESSGFEHSPKKVAVRSGAEDIRQEATTEVNTPGVHRDPRRMHGISGSDRTGVHQNALREPFIRIPSVSGDLRVDGQERMRSESGSVGGESEAFDRMGRRSLRPRLLSEADLAPKETHDRVTDGIAVATDPRSTGPVTRRGGEPSTSVRSGIGLEQFETPPKTGSDTATLRIEDDAGKTAHIRVTVRGERVNTRIVHEDRQLVDTLTARSGELRDALSQRGLNDAGISVRATRSGSELGNAQPPARTVAAEVAEGVTSQSEERRHEGRQERRDDREFNQRGEQWQGHSRRRNQSRDETPRDT